MASASRMRIESVMAGLQVWAAYSPVKNSPADARVKAQAGSPSHSATTGELDIYQANCRYSGSCQRRCPLADLA